MAVRFFYKMLKFTLNKTLFQTGGNGDDELETAASFWGSLLRICPVSAARDS